MNNYDIDILRLAAQGFCCSQIVLQLGLEMQGRENPELLRAVSALCHGSGAAGGSCGALSGAACLLGLHGGKGAPEEAEHDRYSLMLSELTDWFTDHCRADFNGISCTDIVADGLPDSEICGGLISACLLKAITLLQENGIDPAQ